MNLEEVKATRIIIQDKISSNNDPMVRVIEELDQDDLPKKNPFVRGLDPRVATCRGRLQNKRCQLNQEINKELRLRAGAENLFKATTNRKLRENVALELSFVNSNLQLLKEQLAELNSSVELYQKDSKECVMPMIPLGLKETKDVEFREPFKDFILEHYSEDAAVHDDAISDFMDMRQAIRTPVRTATGVSLLFRYYNQLYFVERRFFPPDRSLGIYFEWFDSLTGVPSCQRTVAFEKACVLFNMAAIYTQIGAKQERRSARGLDGAVDALLRAAGTLRYIHENFTNAPSVDLSAPALDVLVDLMMAQARECLLEKLSLQAAEECAARDLELCDDLHLCLDLCHECAQLSACYGDLYQKMQSESVFHYVPYSWVSLVHVKTEFYKGLAHHHCATGLLSAGGTGGGVAEERLCEVGGRSVDGVVAGSEAGGDVDRAALGRAHLREALALYEEALRLQRMCRELRGKAALSSVLRSRQQRAARDCATALGDGPDFTEIIDPPQVQPSSKFQLSLTPPDFAQHRVEDLFRALGPLAVFSAKRHWSAPRLVQLHRYTSSVTRGARRREEVVRPPRRDRSEDNGVYYVNGRSHTQENGDKDIASSRKSKHMYTDSYTNNNSDVGYDSGERDEEETGEKTGGDRSELVVSAVAGPGMGSCARALRRAASDVSVSRCSEADDGFGFSVRGDAPVVVASVDPGSLADLGGVRAGDLVVGVCGRDARWARHEEVVRLVRRARARGLALTLKLVTPRESAARHQESSPRPLAPTTVPVSAGGSMSASSASSGGSARARAWNPFRRHTPTRALTHSNLSNVIFR